MIYNMETKDYPYVTKLDILYPHLQTVDVPEIAACKDQWFNQTLTKVNDSVGRIGVGGGEYHWRKHDNEDEFFSSCRESYWSIWKTAPSNLAPSKT